MGAYLRGLFFRSHGEVQRKHQCMIRCEILYLKKTKTIISLSSLSLVVPAKYTAFTKCKKHGKFLKRAYSREELN